MEKCKATTIKGLTAWINKNLVGDGAAGPGVDLSEAISAICRRIDDGEAVDLSRWK